MLNTSTPVPPRLIYSELQARLGFDAQVIATFCQQNRIQRMALFGSVLREDFSTESDIDVLVEFEPDAKPGLIGFMQMADKLTDLLGRKVDFLTEGFINRYFRQRVLNEAVPIYERHG